jgi:hypothetical protein
VERQAILFWFRRNTQEYRDGLRGSALAHLKRERSEMMAVFPNLTVKSLGCSHTLASGGDINEEIQKVSLG